jgi:hypothetical protein
MTGGHSARLDSASHVDGATVAEVDDEPKDMAEDDDGGDEDDSTYQQSSFDAEADFDSDSHSTTTDGDTAAGVKADTGEDEDHG